METDPDRFASLEEELVQYWTQRGGQPANVKIQTFNHTFEAAASGVLEAMREQKAQLAPTLAFIDPFGWSGVSLGLIAELVSFDKCEVLFNFMYDSVNRFVTDERPNVAKHFAALFGSSEGEHHAAAGLTGDDRKNFLRDLYMARLQEVGGFRFVRSFELMDVEQAVGRPHTQGWWARP